MLEGAPEKGGVLGDCVLFSTFKAPGLSNKLPKEETSRALKGPLPPSLLQLAVLIPSS